MEFKKKIYRIRPVYADKIRKVRYDDHSIYKIMSKYHYYYLLALIKIDIINS